MMFAQCSACVVKEVLDDAVNVLLVLWCGGGNGWCRECLACVVKEVLDDAWNVVLVCV